jgi:hypothetical protein
MSANSQFERAVPPAHVEQRVNGDLFWHPKVGERVLIRPGSHAAQFKTAASLAIRQEVTKDAGEVDGHPMVWITPTGPVTYRTDKRGRQIADKPTHQTPVLVEELMPTQDPAAEANASQPHRQPLRA